MAPHGLHRCLLKKPEETPRSTQHATLRTPEKPEEKTNSPAGVGALADVLKHHRALLQLALGNNHMTPPLGWEITLTVRMIGGLEFRVLFKGFRV